MSHKAGHRRIAMFAVLHALVPPLSWQGANDLSRPLERVSFRVSAARRGVLRVRGTPILTA
jgi:hypothetical protein